MESLLSAKVADGMTGRKHRSNMELVAQGIANIASALFGGISVTGTIARTATNVRAGASSPLSGMMHAAFLLLFMLVARAAWPASCRSRPWPACWWWCAGTWPRRRSSSACCATGAAPPVLLATFGLTLVRDLTTGIVAGCVLAAVLAVFQRGVAEEGA